MRYLLLFISLSALVSACQQIELSVSQTPIQEQEVPYKTYLAIGNLCQATDGAVVTVLLRTASNQVFNSYTYSSSNGIPYLERSEVAVVKTNSQGQVEWTKLVWSGANSSYFRPLIYPLSDGGYLVFLNSYQYTANSSNRNLTLIHLNNVGEVLTKEPVVGTNLNESFTAQGGLSLPDKGFIISGRIYEGSGAVPFLMRFDNQGKLTWSNSYPQVTQILDSYGITTTTDGGFILSWHGFNSAKGQQESYLLKIDATGQLAWARTYGLFSARTVSASADDGCVLLGIIQSNLQYVFLYKLDKDGNIKWIQQYDSNIGTGQYLGTQLGLITSADSYIAVYSVSPNTIQMITTNLAGDQQSRQSLDGPSTSIDNGDMLGLSDGSFVFSGKDRSALKAIVLLKTKPDKTFQWNSTIAISN